MRTSDPAPTGESTLGRDLIHAVRYYLGGGRALLVLIAILVAAGLVSNWTWLVAIGAAPLLLAMAPCAVMCALGLCMNRMMGRSCSSDHPTPTSVERQAESEESDLTQDDADFARAGRDDPAVSAGLSETSRERS